MFDGSKFGPVPIAANQALFRKLPFEGRYSQETGEDVSGGKTNAFFKGITFTAYSEKGSWRSVAAAGSFHKFFNGGAHNYNDFHRKDFFEVVGELCGILGVSPVNVPVHNLEFGVNICLDFDPNLVLMSLLTYKGIPFERPIENRYYYQCQTDDFIIKVYDKGRQYNLAEQLLRVELKVVKMRFLHTKGISIKTFEDLLNQEHYPKLGRILVGYTKEILFRNRMLDVDGLSKADKELVARGGDKEYWQRPESQEGNAKGYESARKKLQREEARYRLLNLQDWHHVLFERIASKWNQLTDPASITERQIAKRVDDSNCPKFTKLECPKFTEPENDQMSQIHTLDVRGIWDNKHSGKQAKQELSIRRVSQSSSSQRGKGQGDIGKYRSAAEQLKKQYALSNQKVATFNVSLNERPNKDGLFTIFVRVTENRKHVRFKMEFRVPEDHFDKKAAYGRWITKANPRHLVFNTQIEKRINELKERYYELARKFDDPLAHIKHELVDPSLGNYFNDYLVTVKKSNAPGYYRKVKSALGQFKEFFSDDTPLISISDRDIIAFRQYRLVQGDGIDTVNQKLKSVHTVFRIALYDDLILSDPFLRIKPLKTRP